MNLYGLSSAAAHEHVRDLSRTACNDRLAASALCCRESGVVRAARRVSDLARRDSRA